MPLCTQQQPWWNGTLGHSERVPASENDKNNKYDLATPHERVLFMREQKHTEQGSLAYLPPPPPPPPPPPMMIKASPRIKPVPFTALEYCNC